MNHQNLERLGAHLRSLGVEAALLSSPFTLTWLTGYAPPIQTGPSPFEGGSALGWWRGGGLTLVLSDAEADAARERGAEVREYVGYSVEEPLEVTERQAAVLRDLLREEGVHGAEVGAELNFLPASLVRTLEDFFPAGDIRPLKGEMDDLRAVKGEDEIAKVRAALALCDMGQSYVRQNLQAGVTEIELWGEMKARMEVMAGGRLPVLADLVAGVRTAEIGGEPGGYALGDRDPVILDIVPRLDGYWGDNAGTYFVGGSSPEMAKAYGVVQDTLHAGVESVRPGVRARDLDAMLRDRVHEGGYDPYPHHSGHGIGVSYHEEPRIVTYNEKTLEAGMIVALEPGIYLPGAGGVRLEHVVLVTHDGCEVLTTHLEGTT
jgi:Xaa-Pro aminopeptidase